MQPVTIFGRDSCGFCRRAKELCENRDFNFRYVDIEKEGITKADLEKTIGEPVSTVPQIFVGKKHIGGFQEFSAFVEDGATEQAAN